jgi:hypothetical protein
VITGELVRGGLTSVVSALSGMASSSAGAIDCEAEGAIGPAAPACTGSSAVATLAVGFTWGMVGVCVSETRSWSVHRVVESGGDRVRVVGRTPAWRRAECRMRR